MPPKPKLNVHNFPRPPLLEKTPRHIQVKWRGQTIADTKDAYWVLETTHPPSKFSSQSSLPNSKKKKEKKYPMTDSSQHTISPQQSSPPHFTLPRIPPSANGKDALHTGISNPRATTKKSLKIGHGVMSLPPKGSKPSRVSFPCTRGPGIAM